MKSRSPASLAWDIILSRSKSNTVIEHLLRSFGDSRYIEDYRFSHLHEIVLDRKHTSIEDALSRDPSWINCTDTHQNTPLLWASRRGNNAHVQTLLHCGADSSIKNDVGEAALIESVYFGRLDCMLSLLRANAPISEAADGKKILHHACKLRDDLAYIKPIIERGTDINRRDCLSRTPLALASSMNHYRTIKYLATLLFSYGADITATDVDNLTILHKAALSANTSMMKLLQTQDLRGLYPDTLDILGEQRIKCLWNINRAWRLLLHLPSC
jgi:ankyrin repeat protein